MKIDLINIHFTKMTGAGNDFILIDNRSNLYLLDWMKLAPEICNRRYGVGADGLIILERSDKADFKMSYFNADGSFGGMCGNGGRCSALFIMESDSLASTKFEALDYIYTADATNDTKIKLKMKAPKSLRLNIELNLLNDKVTAHFIDTGAPHAVLFMNDLSSNLLTEIRDNGITRIGSTIQHHDNFAPEGTNVDFIEIINRNSISMRTYERGVEDETFACGTGAIASAIIASLLKNLNSQINVQTRSKEILEVMFDKERKEIKNVELIGCAKKVFEGNYQTLL
jgi:diaminopimelate epimerase